MSKYIHKSHNVTVLLYHLVFPTKYRRLVIDTTVDHHLKDICLEIAKRYEIHFVEIGSDKDHVHFLIQSVPISSITKLVTMIKSITAKRLFFIMPHLKKELWGSSLWTSGYYHVSDTYIALFSSFIACGVWEAIHILDGLLENRSEIRPDTLHADTQGQSETVFGLAYVLAIQLMPRIRNWKHLTLYAPSQHFAAEQIQHIRALFSDTIDWPLLQTHLPDRLRVAVSISQGKVRSSTLLRKLGTESRKNKLYVAFRELGRVVRTVFLLRFINEEELRRTINASTNTIETWNGFVQWAAFGGNGVIRENSREEQRKIIRYNHLVANLMVFHNVVSMTRVLQELIDEGHPVTPLIIARLSPYKTEHINRFGNYEPRFDQVPLPITEELRLSPVPRDNTSIC